MKNKNTAINIVAKIAKIVDNNKDVGHNNYEYFENLIIEALEEKDIKLLYRLEKWNNANKEIIKLQAKLSNIKNKLTFENMKKIFKSVEKQLSLHDYTYWITCRLSFGQALLTALRKKLEEIISNDERQEDK